MSANDTRRPRSVYSVGDEPEVQASLANERTALSWIRTGLTLIAGGVALATLSGFGDLPSSCSSSPASPRSITDCP